MRIKKGRNTYTYSDEDIAIEFWTPDIAQLHIFDSVTNKDLVLYRDEAQLLYEFLNHLACEGELEL